MSQTLEARLARLELVLGIDPKSSCQGDPDECAFICTSESCPAQQSSVHQLEQSTSDLSRELRVLQYTVEILGKELFGKELNAVRAQASLMTHQHELKDQRIPLVHALTSLSGTNEVLQEGAREALLSIEEEILRVQVALEDLK